MNLKSLISSSTAFTIIMMVSVFNVAKADEKVVATVSSDESKINYKLVVDSNDGREIKHFYKDVYENGKRIARDEIFAPVLIKTGVILEQREKHVVMKLKSNDFNLDQGGMVIIDTLYSGISGQRKTYEVQLAQDKAGWSLFQHGKVINDIQIKTNRVKILGAIGIKTLVMK